MRPAAPGYRYSGDQSGHFASLEGSLVSVSMHQLTVLDEQNKTLYDEAVKFQSPALSVGDGRAAAYDVGGTAVYVPVRIRYDVHT